MKIEDIPRANQLKEEIREFEFFINNVLKIDPITIRYIDGVVKKEITTKYSIMGSRNFGGGHHAEEINIPKDLLEDLRSIAKKRLVELKFELEQL